MQQQQQTTVRGRKARHSALLGRSLAHTATRKTRAAANASIQWLSERELLRECAGARICRTHTMPDSHVTLAFANAYWYILPDQTDTVSGESLTWCACAGRHSRVRALFCETNVFSRHGVLSHICHTDNPNLIGYDGGKPHQSFSSRHNNHISVISINQSNKHISIKLIAIRTKIINAIQITQ